jgi:hypothetical protein
LYSGLHPRLPMNSSINTPSRHSSALSIGSIGRAGQYGQGYHVRERNGSPRPLLLWLLLALLWCLVLLPLLLVVLCRGRYACRPAARVRRWMSSIDQIQYVDQIMNMTPARAAGVDGYHTGDAGMFGCKHRPHFCCCCSFALIGCSDADVTLEGCWYATAGPGHTAVR